MLGDSIGFHLNISKCELISSPDFQVSDVTLKYFSRTSIADASLLGVPLFPGVVFDEAWAARCSELSRAVERLKGIDSRMRSLCYVLLSVLHAFNIFSVVPLLRIIRL